MTISLLGWSLLGTEQEGTLEFFIVVFCLYEVLDSLLCTWQRGRKTEVKSITNLYLNTESAVSYLLSPRHYALGFT